MNSFEELEAWKVSKDLRNSLWDFVKRLPKEETYRLNDQIIRASRSVTANIAEGFGRFHYQENIQFCRHARGSLYEIIDHLICASNCGYLDENELIGFKQDIANAIKILNGYIFYLKKAKENEAEK
ncbi:MAG: four helix bundle protein [Bacteroidetes bacterium]|nr:four helix bundle protein [Bacteroidota bacterium]